MVYQKEKRTHNFPKTNVEKTVNFAKQNQRMNSLKW